MIDSIFQSLARIQNSDDAKAKEVRIKLITNTSSKKITNKQTIIVQNNGLPFSEEDWNRLIKIAEGNPNEDAVGCFGVSLL